MGYGLELKAGALVLCGGLVMVLLSACELPSYRCETAEPGGTDDEIPTESVGAGDFLRGGDDGEGGGEEVGSAPLAMAGSCSPVHSCTEMYEKCQEIGGRCTRKNSHGYTYCEICRDDCQLDRPYTYEICFRCGFH
ncbi:uncharacterized protein SOCE26_085050 [Sorangium cellulosum]|uniref:Uncharacterized protein n=1 Tax=Sorangium cellulosum TaxID=56 RepID=A0A2L0F5Y3_SORCE|nr:uncharacterized protein SOCE26_085050 [Sorangium cellulosum]